MTATVENYAGYFFKLIDAESSTKFCDISNRCFSRTAFYRHKKSKVHLAMLSKKLIQTKFSLVMIELS